MSNSEFNYEAHQIMGATIIVQVVIVILLIIFLVKRIRKNLSPLSEIGVAMQGLSEGKLDQTLTNCSGSYCYFTYYLLSKTN